MDAYAKYSQKSNRSWEYPHIFYVQTGSNYPDDEKMLEQLKSHYTANNTLIRNLIKDLGQEKFNELGGKMAKQQDYDFGEFVRENTEFDPDDRWLERWVIMEFDEEIWEDDDYRTFAYFDNEDEAQEYFDEMKEDLEGKGEASNKKAYLLEKQEGHLEGWMDTKDGVDENITTWEGQMEAETIDTFYSY